MNGASSICEVRAQSWAHLMDEVYRDSWDPGLERHRSSFVFRGTPDCRFSLRTSLARLAGPARTQQSAIAGLERHLVRNFRKYAWGQVRDDSVWHWLALAAHHALPTRLLDWSFSPLVAFHFATASPDFYDRDGVVWCVDHRETNQCLPKPFLDRLEFAGSAVFTVEALSEAVQSLDDLERFGEQGEFVVYLEPPSLDARIVNQFALFSLMSSPASSLDEWLAVRTKRTRRLIIPADLKWEVRDKLDQAGITERVLFPGLDGLAAWLTRYYAARDRRGAPSDQDAPCNQGPRTT